MSAAVMYATPALPPVRKASVWEKMFSGFKASNKKEDKYEAADVYEVPSRMEQTWNMSTSTSTGVERNTLRVHKRNGSTATKASTIAPSIRSTTSRAGSLNSTYSRRSSKKWWRSSNPEADDAPPVPAIDSKYQVFGSHNPDVDSTPTTRKPGYVPRNAAGAFLKSTTTKAMQRSTQDNLDEASRQLSIGSDKATHQAPLKPIQIKTIELRKDSHVGIEKHAMFSMAGVCEIIEESDGDENMAVAPAPHKRADTPTRQSVERADSAKASPDFLPLKDSAQREPSLLEGTAV